jgi:hypothetical protein
MQTPSTTGPSGVNDLDELELAPKKVQDILKQIPDKYLKIVQSNTETDKI